MGKSFDGSRPAKWFRMWAEFATDPKIQILSEQLQRRFLMLLCLRCSNGDETLQDVSIACYLRISPDEWSSTKQSLLVEGLIDGDAKPVSWNKRQYCSDVSTGRVKAYRDRNRGKGNVSETLHMQKETFLKRPETPPETETETETESKSKAVRTFVRPSLEEVATYCKERKNYIDPQKWLDHYLANGFRVGKTAMRDWKASIRTWERSDLANGNGHKKQVPLVNAADLRRAEAQAAKEFDLE